jgi:myo-inositol-1(or 4)-monophosphatase
VLIDNTNGDQFTASPGPGAEPSGSPLAASSTADLGASLVATGFPYDRRTNAARYGVVFSRVLAEIQGVRRSGSAALDMCHVACGRLDAYWEQGLGAWDAAAALLVVSEAGGHWTSFGGGPYRLGSGGVVVTNGLVHEALVAVVGDGS